MSVIARVFSEVYKGKIFTSEAEQLVHLFCNHKGLNPAFEKPITMLKLSHRGQERLREYEEFIMSANWIIAKLAAKEISVTQALSDFNKNMNKLSCYRQEIKISDEVIDAYFNRNYTCNCEFQNIYSIEGK